MRTIPLRYLAAVNAQALPEDTDPDYAFRYVDISQVSSTGHMETGVDAITFKAAPSRARRLAPAGSTVVSTVRTYLRAIAQVPESDELLVFSTGFATIEAQTGDPRFLTYACQSTPFVEEVVARSTGVSYPAINASDMSAIALPWPSDEEQRRIADFLDDRVGRVDQIIAARQQQERLVAEASAVTLEHEVRRLSEARGEAPLRRFGFTIEQGWSPEADSVPAVGDEAGILKLGAVRNGVFDATQNKRMLDETTPRDDYALHAGDLLITRANTPSLVGDVALVEEDFPHLYLSDLIYRINLHAFSHAAACAALRTQQIRQTIGVLARGTSSSMPKLRGEDIAALPLPRATEREQAGLAALDRKLRTALSARRAQLRSQVDLLQEYKQSLITAAVTGEFDVTTASTRIPE